MRKFRISRWAVLVLAGVSAPSGVLGQTARKAPHERKLQQEIELCAQKVNCASSLEQRCQQQEELCKKLLQAEDYDHALQVASAVHATEGVNPERRAAHHYLVARIYSMRMEASSSQSEMEQNRRKALETAQDIIAQNYPKNWRVGDAAARLVQDLQDQRKLAVTQSKIAKRQAGGVDPRLVSTAAAQSKYFKDHVPSSIPAKGTHHSATATPARDALASKFSRSRGVNITNSTKPLLGNFAKASYSSSGARISDARTGSLITTSGKLKGPVLISGATVKPLSGDSSAYTSGSGSSIKRSGIGSPAAATSEKSGSKSTTTSKRRRTS